MSAPRPPVSAETPLCAKCGRPESWPIHGPGVTGHLFRTDPSAASPAGAGEETAAPYRCGECEFTAIAGFAALAHEKATGHRWSAIADYAPAVPPPRDAALVEALLAEITLLDNLCCTVRDHLGMTDVAFNESIADEINAALAASRIRRALATEGATGPDEALRDLREWLADDGHHVLASGIVPATAPSKERRSRWLALLDAAHPAPVPDDGLREARKIADWHEETASFAERSLSGYRNVYKPDRIASEKARIAWHRQAAATLRAALGKDGGQ